MSKQNKSSWDTMQQYGITSDTVNTFAFYILIIKQSYDDTKSI